ncbi:MAG: hypothetical protein JRI25_15850, partial [Deltaproteobacteria bacterium]|nr:hypothetical protein [Deltaproteobacteria bacterium]
MFWFCQPLWLILLGGCVAGGDIRRPDIDDSADTSDTGMDDTGEPDGPCPSHMVLVDEAFCIDRYEGALEEQQPDGSWTPASPYLTLDGRTVRAVPAVDAVPQGYISGD